VRHYQCCTRRHHGTPAEPDDVPRQTPEDQRIDWLHTFQPHPRPRQRIIDAIRSPTGLPGENGERRWIAASRRRPQTGWWIVSSASSSLFRNEAR